MKKLVLLALLIIGLNCNAQEVGVTYGFLKNAISMVGTYPLKNDMHIAASAEYSKPVGFNGELKLYKFGIGGAYQWTEEKSARAALLITYQDIIVNTVPREDFNPNRLYKISFEVGVLVVIEGRADILMFFDPLNFEPRVGLGYRFGDERKSNKPKQKKLKYL